MDRLTVAKLIDMLSELDLDAEVRIAHQPEYPMQLLIAGVVENGSEDTCSARCCQETEGCGCGDCKACEVPEMCDPRFCCDEADNCGDCLACGGVNESKPEEGDKIVYIMAGEHPSYPESPYVSKELWNKL